MIQLAVSHDGGGSRAQVFLSGNSDPHQWINLPSQSATGTGMEAVATTTTKEGIRIVNQQIGKRCEKSDTDFVSESSTGEQFQQMNSCFPIV